MENFPESLQNTDAFQLLLALKNVCKISFKHKISKDFDLESLRQSTTEVFRLINLIDPNFKIFPKLHQITHYPDIIQQFGPLINFSTLRYERKHRFFKRWAKIMCNHINPSYSLANRHQCYFVQAFDAVAFSEYVFDFQPHPNINPEILPQKPSLSYPLINKPYKLDKSILHLFTYYLNLLI